MTQNTTNYKLQKYEATDAPDLTAQYNASMDALDAKLKEAADLSQAASSKSERNTSRLNALGAVDDSTAGENKAKWDKAAADAQTALTKVNSLPSVESQLPTGLKAFCNALGLTDHNAGDLGTTLNHLLNRTAATANGTYTAKSLAETKITAEGLPFVPANSGRSEEEERGE